MGILFRSMKHISKTVKCTFVGRNYCVKVPKHPHIPNFDRSDNSKSIEIDIKTVRYLERLSLVNFGNYEGIKILQSSIKFAENLIKKDTVDIKPLSSVLENRTLSLREDIVTEGNNRNIVMSNAKVIEEEYFVAPPGNIPLQPDEIEIKDKKLKLK